MQDEIFLFSLLIFSKEFIFTVWILLILAGIAGFFACRYHKAFLVVSIFLTAYLSFILLNAKANSEFGKYSSERIELTPIYLFCFFAIIFSALFPLIGLIINIRRNSLGSKLP